MCANSRLRKAESVIRAFFQSIAVLQLLLLSSWTVEAATVVVFRYDDFAGDRPNARNTNTLRRQVWEAEQRVDAAFERAGFAYTVAVIPLAHPRYRPDGLLDERAPLQSDVEKVEFLRRGIAEHRIEVAQHGLSHIDYCAPSHRPAEFRERGYLAQFEDIIRGREILERGLHLRIRTFVPPWNGWDRNTAKALVAAGFRMLSADTYYCYGAAEGLEIIPCTTSLRRFERLALQQELADPGVYVVLYHPFSLVRYPTSDVSCYYAGIARFEALLERLSRMPRVNVTTLTEAAATAEFSHERYLSANRLERQRDFWSRLLPEEYRPGEPDASRYLPAADYRRLADFWRAITVLLAAGLLGVGVLGRHGAVVWLPPQMRVWANRGALLLLAIGVAGELRLLQRGYHLTGIRAIPVFVAAGYLAATVVSLVTRGGRGTPPRGGLADASSRLAVSPASDGQNSQA